MKKWAEVALGAVTGIGGFLEIGSVSTAMQAGGEFRLQLIWVLLAGTLGLVFLMEMTGRLAAVSRRTYADQVRERFGLRFFLVPLVAVFLVAFLVLASEIGGVSLALEMATGIGHRWWAMLVALIGWILLWRGTFELVEQGTAILGLVSLAFLVAAIKLHPEWGAAAAALMPSRPAHDAARYWYLAVAILGSSISPYLFVFFSSGVVESGWTPDYLGVNRLSAVVGNVFGGALAIMVLIAAAVVLSPGHINPDTFPHMALVLSTPLGRTGTVLFVATLCITCFGATLEVVLSLAYLLAQGFGWAWSQNLRPAKDARFSVTYSALIFAAALVIVAGVDPLKLTNLSMVATAASLPMTVVPLAVLMNDADIMATHVNGWPSNVALGVLIITSIAIFLAAIPLQILGGG